ncbi:MAG: hypothetical protein SGI73_17170 [Chloroflexota bacterium]|nr:hypothetical protein [Chloroflexota bacterium]
MTETPKQSAIVAAFYGLIALIVLANPLFHLNGFVPGQPTTDYYHFHWNFWWIRHALEGGLNVYATNYVMAPQTSSLVFHTLTPFWYPVWALIEPLFPDVRVGTVVGMSAVFFAILTLTGWTAFTWLRREGVARGLALIGGAIFMLLPIMLNSLYWTNINIMSWFWLPAILLLWGNVVRAVERGSVRFGVWVMVLGVALWGMLLTDIQFPLLIAPVVVPFGVKTIFEARRRVRLVMDGVVGVGIALTLTWIVGLLPAILAADRSGFAPTPADRAVEIPFPAGLFARTLYLESVGALVIPLVIAALVFRLVRRRRATDEGGGASGAPRRIVQIARPALTTAWFWFALVPLPLLLALGAVTPFYSVLHEALGGMFRYPERFVPVFALPALAFIGLTGARARFTRSAAFAAGALLIVVAEARIFHPMPLQALPPDYAFYDVMRAEPYDYVIVDIPTAGMSGEGIVGEPIYPTTQFYGLTHEKRMVNGHLSRVNTYTYMYMRTDDPMMAWLGQRRLLEADIVREQMRERILDFPIGYFVLHRQWIEPYGTTQQEIIGYFNQLGDLVCPFAVEGAAVVYRTTWHPDGCPVRTPPEIAPGVYEIDIGGADDVRYLGWGWHPAEPVGDIDWRWAGQPLFGQTDARLYVDLPVADTIVTLNAQAFHEARELRIRVNETTLDGAATIRPDGLADYSFTIPASALDDGQHIEIALVYDAAIIPADVNLGSDARPLAIAVNWIRFAAG